MDFHIPFSLHLQCWGMLVGGMLVHLLLVKIPSIKKRGLAVNKPFSSKDWLKEDGHLIAGTIVIGFLVTIGLNELANWKPAILDYIKWFYAGIGGFGSTIVMAKFSQYESLLTKLVDVKSNLADKITGGSTTVAETIAKADDVGITVTASPKKTETGAGNDDAKKN